MDANPAPTNPCDAVSVDIGAYENADCNSNGTRDELELFANDDNSDGIPDTCQDCNSNDIPDEWDIAPGGISDDCNGNGLPDECDIGVGCSTDCDDNEAPDECDLDSGTNLRQFAVPVPGDTNGRGLAFDGEYLYFTYLSPGPDDFNIHRITTLGVSQGEITPSCSGVPTGVQIGALAYDDSSGTPTLWCASYYDPPEQAIIFSVEISTGEVLETIDTLPSSPDDLFPNHIDGLAYDSSDNSLFYSTDLGLEVFNISATGGAGCTAAPAEQNPDRGYYFDEGDLSGHTLDGTFLYVAQGMELGGDPNANPAFQIFRTFTASPTIGVSFETLLESGSAFQPEDLAFDDVTFAPQCVVWANEAITTTTNRIAAFEVPCACAPDCPADFDGDCEAGVLDLLFLLSAWGSDPGGPPDIDGDGNVGVLDLLVLLASWGTCPSCPTAPPPPSLAEVVEEAGLTYPDDWSEFMNVMMDLNHRA